MTFLFLFQRNPTDRDDSEERSDRKNLNMTSLGHTEQKLILDEKKLKHNNIRGKGQILFNICFVACNIRDNNAYKEIMVFENC
jgi:hypothetical protein